MADIEYTKNKQIITTTVCIGRMPVMLRCNKCVLYNKSEEELSRLGECPLDPGGYFVIRGVEKVILIHEQLSNNRIILETNGKGFLNASVTSSTHERKSKTDIYLKNNCFYVKSNSFTEDIPFVIIMKVFQNLLSFPRFFFLLTNFLSFFLCVCVFVCVDQKQGMGIESDQEIVQLVGSKSRYASAVVASLEECASKKIFSQQQALEYIGGKIKVVRKVGQWFTRRVRSKQEEARDSLSAVILSHIPVESQDFRPKAIYAALMVRRIIQVLHDPSKMDDKDYYGNKRLQLAGQLVSLLFEDLFKQYNGHLRMTIDKTLEKQNRAQNFDVSKLMTVDLITKGLTNSISSGSSSFLSFFFLSSSFGISQTKEKKTLIKHKHTMQETGR